MVGYVFDEHWAQRNRAPLERFFAAMHKAEDVLREMPAEWQQLAPRIGVNDAGVLDVYRRRFLEGIPRRSIADEDADAQALYRVLAEIGGADLVGPARELDPGTFYRAGAGE